jgi:hypothetical protein
VLATIHANDTRAMLDRLCQLIEEVMPTAARMLVVQTGNVCVHIRRWTSLRRPRKAPDCLSLAVGTTSWGMTSHEGARCTYDDETLR